MYCLAPGGCWEQNKHKLATAPPTPLALDELIELETIDLFGSRVEIKDKQTSHAVMVHFP